MEQQDVVKCLTVEQMAVHLEECGLPMLHSGKFARLMDLPVVIRTGDTDFGLAAIHIENDRLVLDLGKALVS